MVEENAEQSTMFASANTTTWSDYEQEFASSDAGTADRIWRVGSPILLAVGLVGNALSAMVMRRKGLRSSVTSLYLLVLAFSDSSVLLVALVYNWLSYGYHQDIQNFSNFTCKLHKLLMFFCIHFEAWVLVSVTLERLAAVAFPFRAKTCFTRARARLGLIITALVLLGINSHFLWDTHLTDTEHMGGRCSYKEVYGGFCGWYSNAWSLIDLVLSSLLPFAAMLVMNSVIIWKLYQSCRFRRSQSDVIKLPAKPHQVRFDPRLPSGSQPLSSARPMAVLLLAITFLFIILSAPICILILLGKVKRCEPNQNKAELQTLFVHWAVVNVVAYSNNSINFFLYFLSGRRFRSQLQKMMCGCSKKSSRSLQLADLAERRLLSQKPTLSMKTGNGSPIPGKELKVTRLPWPTRCPPGNPCDTPPLLPPRPPLAVSPQLLDPDPNA